MADQQKTSQADAGFSVAQLTQIAAIVAEMRKPFVDPTETAKIEAAKQRMREQRAESEANIKAGQDGCAHLRGDNTSTVAWAQYYHRTPKLFIYEGYCQRCNKHFHPGIGDEYARMLKVPVGQTGLVN